VNTAENIQIRKYVGNFFKSWETKKDSGPWIYGDTFVLEQPDKCLMDGYSISDLAFAYLHLEWAAIRIILNLCKKIKMFQH
jgi:hypothetical protein